MTRKDTARFIAKMKAMFPASYANSTPEEISGVVAVWQELFEGFPPNPVFQALSEYAMTNATPFAPSPGQIHKIINEHAKPKRETMNKYEAWELVEKTMQGSDMHYEPKKAFDNLPKLIKLAVGNMRTLRNWSLMDLKDLKWEKNNFLMRYQEIVDTEEDRLSLPGNTITYLGEKRKSINAPQ